MNTTTTNKTIGYILLAAGLLLIILPLYQTYNIFSGKSLPPQIFKNENQLELHQNVSQYDFQKQIENSFMKVLPVDAINQTINLVAWGILTSIFIFGGNRIAQIGIKLIKE